MAIEWSFLPNTPYQAALSWGQGTASCALFGIPQELSTQPHQDDQELVIASRMAARGQDAYFHLPQPLENRSSGSGVQPKETSSTRNTKG